MDPIRYWNKYYREGNNPYSSVGSVPTLGGTDPMEMGSGAPQSLERNWALSPFQPYFGASGVGGFSKVIRDTAYDPELNDALRNRIERASKPVLPPKVRGVKQKDLVDLSSPDFSVDNVANPDPTPALQPSSGKFKKPPGPAGRRPPTKNASSLASRIGLPSDITDEPSGGFQHGGSRAGAGRKAKTYHK